LLIWQARHLSQQQFVLILSVFVGLAAGLVSVLLKNATHIIQDLTSSGNLNLDYNPYYFLFPVIGLVITVFIKRLFKNKGKVGEGIPSALFAISRKNGIQPPYHMYASIITSIFTVGFGGSVGLEGPTVSTGSAIGSNIGRVMRIDYKSRILLMSCATAAALSAIFNAPIAPIIFTIEIFSLDLTLESLIPLLISSAVGAVTSIFIQGNNYMLHYSYVTPFTVNELPIYILLGIVTAFVSIYFTKTYFLVEKYSTRINNKATRALVGGSLLGILVFLFPPLYGEGYEIVNKLLNGNIAAVTNMGLFENFAPSEYFIIIMMFCIVVFKAFATSLTFGAGGVGGIFAPSIYLGGSLGFLFSRFWNTLDLTSISTSNYMLVGMAGLMAGVLHAPLTAVFLIAEVTGGYALFIPLMLVSAISFLVSKHFVPHSIYTTQLAKKGDLLTHNKDKAVLTLLSISNVVEQNFSVVKPQMSLRQLIQLVKTSTRNLFPVVDVNQQLVGILTLDDIRNIMFDESLYDIVAVAELMKQPPSTISKDEPMSSVIQKFQDTGAWNLPVLDEGKYIGFISKSKLFSAYRRKLIEFSG
jgi:CIC family chloride channel protein